MKTLLLVGFALTSFLFFGTAYGQQIKLIGRNSLEPINGATISVNGVSVATTNVRGIAHLKGISGSLEVTHTDFSPKTITAEELTLGIAYLEEKTWNLEEIVISGSRSSEQKKDIARHIETIQSAELNQLSQSNSADALLQNGKVFVQKSQLGGGSPVIRGFEANKIQLVVDGVTMNNAIYRGGHVQNVLTIDVAALEKVEIVYGPGSVVYGSDALGGVLHFYTKKPVFSNSEKLFIQARTYGRYFSASNGYSGHTSVMLGKSKIASFTSFTYSDFGDLMQGANRSSDYPDFGKRSFYVERINGVDSMITNPNPNLQKGSGYSQWDLIQKLRFKGSKNGDHLVNFQHSTSSNINRYDRLTQTSNGLPSFAQWYYGPQDRTLLSYTYSLQKTSRIYDKLQVITSAQWITESRMDRKFKKDFLNHRIEEVGVYAVTLVAEKKVSEHELRYGATFSHNTVNSSAYAQNVVDGSRKDIDTRYPDGGSTMSQSAVYFTHSWEISPKIVLNDGVRMSLVSLNSVFNDKQFFPFTFDNVSQQHEAVNGNIGIVMMPNKKWRFCVSGNSAFRAPNVDDLAKVFETVPGKLVVPNPELKPEYAYAADVTISRSLYDKVHISAVGYYTWIDNVIASLPGTFEGEDSISYNGTLSRVYTSQNAYSGYIYGTELSLVADITRSFSFQSTYTYTCGRVKTDTGVIPLDHIPPGYGKSSIVYHNRKLRAEYFMMYTAWKKLADYSSSGEDNLAFATPEGMPASCTHNIRLSYQINQYFGLQFSCENLLNTNYRLFASNISAPGRNFIGTLRFQLL